MQAVELDCKAVAQAVKASCKEEVALLKQKGISPKLVMLRVGEKGPDLSYEKGATRLMEEAGIETEVYAFPETISQDAYIRALEQCNADPSIHGILAFRPLDTINESEAIGMHMDPRKDVDACTAANLGKVLLGDQSGLYPCTAGAIMALMDYYADIIREIRQTFDPAYHPEPGDDVCAGLEVCIVNNSNVIGKPLGAMLSNRFATTSVIRRLSREDTKRILSSRADVLIAATPTRNTVTADMVRPGALVIDAAVNREKVFDADGNPLMQESTGKQKTRVVGCCAPEVKEVAGYLTPVPGIGSVTSAMLLNNVIKACKQQAGLDTL